MYQGFTRGSGGSLRRLAVGFELRGLLPDARAIKRLNELQRLVDDARPEEDFIGAVAFVAGDGSAQVSGGFGRPDFGKRMFPEIA